MHYQAGADPAIRDDATAISIRGDRTYEPAFVIVRCGLPPHYASAGVPDIIAVHLFETVRGAPRLIKMSAKVAVCSCSAVFEFVRGRWAQVPNIFAGQPGSCVPHALPFRPGFLNRRTPVSEYMLIRKVIRVRATLWNNPPICRPPMKATLIRLWGIFLRQRPAAVRVSCV